MALRTNIVSNDQLKAVMKETLQFLSDTLKNTLGPYGATTIVQDRLLNHQITKDGYSLLKRINIEEDEPRTILELVKKISRNLVRKVGDGSTSSIIIANSLFDSLSGVMRKHKIPAKDLLEVLDLIAGRMSEEIKAVSKPIGPDMAELVHVAAVSTNNDMDYGKLVTEIFQQVGKYGFINLEKSKSERTYYEITSGFETPRGWINQAMANQPDEKTCELLNPYVLLCDDVFGEPELQFFADLAGEICAKRGVPIVVVARSFDNAAATFFHVNVTRNKIPLLAVEMAMESEKSQNRLKDLSLALGGEIYSKRAGERPGHDTINIDRLGCANKVVSTDTFTRFIEGQGDKEKVAARLLELENLIELINKNETYVEMDDEVFQLRKRIASLQSTMANLYVGGYSEDAKDSDKYLLEDAVFACRSALEYGYIPGGNLIVPTLLEDAEVSARVHALFPPEKFELVTDAVAAIREAFLQSFVCVLDNAFGDDEFCQTLSAKCVTDRSIYNLKSHEFEPMSSTAIINSAETDVEIMKSAFSIIGLLVTSNQFISVNTK